MTIGSTLLAVALLLLVGVYVLRPVLVRSREKSADSTTLVSHKERVIAQIRALDLDHETDKISDEAYQLERGKLAREAASLLRQIESAEQPQQIDAEIDAAIARLKTIE